MLTKPPTRIIYSKASNKAYDGSTNQQIHTFKQQTLGQIYFLGEINTSLAPQVQHVPQKLSEGQREDIDQGNLHGSFFSRYVHIFSL